MPRPGRVTRSARPARHWQMRRWQALTLTVLLLVTGSLQQSLDAYAHDLSERRSPSAITPASAITIRVTSSGMRTIYQVDATTGLTHLRARDYDPLTGRFTSADSESPNGALTQGYNAYHYTGNNPTTRTDPSGHTWLAGIPAALQQLIEITVMLVETLRMVVRHDRFPGWVKQFLVTLIVFGLQMILGLLAIILLTVVMEVTGAGETMVGRALLLYRLRAIAKMAQLGAKCARSTSCRFLTRFLTQNPDCLLEAGSTAASYGMTGAPDVLSLTGQVSAGADAAFLAKECLDRTPGRSRAGQINDGSCSFAADTHVLMADGMTRPIAEVEVDDWVLAEDPETGERGPRLVRHLWVHDDELIDLGINGDVVTPTEDHPFWNATDGAWQRADELDAGEFVLTADGDLVSVGGMDWATRTGGVAYNLTVADIHT